MTTKIKHIASNTITTTELDTSSLDGHFSGGTGVTYSAGAISIGQAVAASDSPTFADLTLTGNLNITGNIDQYNVTDLDVTDKTITLGSGQIEANSGGSGIIVDGSNASILWDEANTEWDFNNPIKVTGTISSGAITSTGSSTFTSTSTMDINLVANPPELNFEDTSSTSGTKRARWTLDNNNFSAQALSDNDASVTHALLNFNLSSGAATFGGNVSVGGAAYTTSADLNLLGDGLAIKNDKNGNSNNWSLIQNTSSGSAANLEFITGLGSALTLNHDRSATFAGNLDVTGTITGDDGLSIQGGTGNAYLQVGSDTGSWTWKNYRATHKLALEDSDGTGEVLNFDTSGNATFAGTISSGAITSTGAVTGTYFSDGYVTWNAAQFNRSGAAIEFQFTPTNASWKVKIGANGDNPTEFNAYTGDADFSGEVSTPSAKLKALSKTQTDSTNNVFVYDTRKDSDGGAWRKSSTNTSWYSEASGAKRSARKEFPVVAVIAFNTSQELIIYDGDDPDFPIWAKYTNGFTQDAGVASSVTAKNGAIYCGQRSQNLYSGNGFFKLDFAGDFFFSNIGSVFGTYRQGKSDGLTTGLDFRSRGDRTTSKYSFNSGGGFNVNDLAITVLPNAPIDEETGLPRPTIALATDNGVMVILHNEDVSYLTNSQDSSAFNYIDNIFFREDNSLVWQGDSSSNVASERFTQVKHKLFSANFNQQSVENGNTDEQYGPSHKNGNLRFIGTGGITSSSPNVDNGMALSNNAGLNLISPYKPDGEKGLMAHITSDYNTGWMFSKNIKRALLSSTDSTNLVGTNVCPNGDFSNGTTSWTGNQASISASGGILTVSGTGSFPQNQSANHTAISCNHGDQFFVEFTINERTTNPSSAGIISSGLIEKNNNIGYWYPSATGTFSTRVTANGSSLTIYLHAGTTVGVVTKFSNVKITKMDVQDRCHLNQDVYPQGTIVKSPVETGAELQGYGPFSSSNYLQQPYSAHLDFDQGDFSTCFWVNSAYSTSEYIWDRGDDSGNYRIALYYGSNNNGTMYFYSRDTAATEVSGVIGAPNEWSQVWVIRRGDSHEIWVNGVNKHASSELVRDVSSANGEADLHIGTRFNKDNPNNGKIALLRISAGAPSAEQIKKIYEDEKHLFLPNATATIAGSSNAVTALGYDEDTEILHVGTSAGRSSFQGLNRTDYGSTSSIGNSISASNGLIVEE